MLRLSIKLALFFAIILLVGCSKPNDISVAKAGSYEISTGDLRAEMAASKGKYDPIELIKKQNFDEFRKQALEKLIQEAVLLNEANRLGIKATDEELNENIKLHASPLAPDDYIEKMSEHGISKDKLKATLRKRITIEKLIDKEVFERFPVSDKEIKRYYNKHIQDFRQPTQFRARQIIVDTRELAEEILAKLNKGKDFAELAHEHSLSPDNKSGGDLGYFDASSYPGVFSEICQKLKIGETSEVITTDYGYQIFQLLDRRPARQKKLEEVNPLIRRLLAEENSWDSFKEWFVKLKEETPIEINDKVLEKIEINKKG